MKASGISVSKRKEDVMNARSSMRNVGAKILRGGLHVQIQK